MTRLALLCSGQGFQHPGMFELTGEAAAAAPVFAAAKAALDGRDPRAIVRDADEAMHENATAQILCCTQAAAMAALLRDSLGSDVVIAGYSVGELAAWGVAGVFDAETLLHLASRRAAAMDAAAATTPGGMAAIRGLSRRQAEDLCRAHGAHVAIVNGRDQIVIGGSSQALSAALATIGKAGAGKATRLAVGVPSHTPLLAEAVGSFGDALHAAKAHPLAADRRLVSGIDGATVVSIDDGFDKLARQLAQTIDWQACMDECRAAGVSRALELGPGTALAKLMSDGLGARDSRSIEDFRSIDGIRHWIETT